MTDEEIVAKINALYKDEKSKKFMSHLIRSFFPQGKTEFLWDDDPRFKKMECCITGTPLMSKSGALSKYMAPDKKDIIIRDMKQQFLGCEGEKKVDMIQEVFEGAVLAVVSPESNVCLCKQAYGMLHIWITNQLLGGNKHINWLLKDMRAKEFCKQRGMPEKEEKFVRKAVANKIKPTEENIGTMYAIKCNFIERPGSR